jgi:Rrf2 family protein
MGDLGGLAAALRRYGNLCRRPIISSLKSRKPIHFQGEKLMFKLSEAAALALHTAGLLAAQPDRLVTTRDVASHFKVSQAHLSKVMQRLVKVGLIRSSRGPGGGFSLTKPPEEITLLNVYEAIEGPLELDRCLLGHPACPVKTCVMSGLKEIINRETWQYLSSTCLSQLTGCPAE